MSEADLNNWDHDPTEECPIDEREPVNPIIQLVSMAAPSYFEVDWKRGACHGTLPDNLKRGFTSDQNFRSGRAGKSLTADAISSIAVCMICPIRQACYEHGLTEEGGIWGGAPHQSRKEGKFFTAEDANTINDLVRHAVTEADTLEGQLRALSSAVESKS